MPAYLFAGLPAKSASLDYLFDLLRLFVQMVFQSHYAFAVKMAVDALVFGQNQRHERRVEFCRYLQGHFFVNIGLIIVRKAHIILFS